MSLRSSEGESDKWEKADMWMTSAMKAGFVVSLRETFSSLPDGPMFLILITRRARNPHSRYNSDTEVGVTTNKMPMVGYLVLDERVRVTASSLQDSTFLAGSDRPRRYNTFPFVEVIDSTNLTRNTRWTKSSREKRKDFMMNEDLMILLEIPD